MSRVCMFIKKGLKYYRKDKYEDETVSMIWVKLCTSRRKYLMIGGIYREWKSPNINIPDSSKDLHDQKKRLSKIMEKVKQVANENDNIMYLGDMNVDMLESNDPLGVFFNKKLYEII